MLDHIDQPLDASQYAAVGRPQQSMANSSFAASSGATKVRQNELMPCRW